MIFRIITFFIIKTALAFNFQDILIKKPYEIVFDTTTTTDKPIHVDQLDQQCPLAFGSSSLETGCKCNFSTNTIECIYSNRLGTIPTFYQVDSKINWSIDLKCKNLSYLSNLRAFLPLIKINVLDLSASLDPRIECKNVHNLTLSKLIKLGHQVKNIKEQNLKIDQLNLENNHLKSINLINNTSYDLKINSLRLSHNQLETLDIKTHLDLCYLKLDYLNISNNQIKRIEIGYLIFLKQLNISNNHLTTFLVDFYNSNEFRIYHGQSCRFDNTSNLHSTLIDIDLSINYLSFLPFKILDVQYSDLVNLNVSQNRLREIRNYEFSTISSLKRLDLSHNLISNLFNKSLSGLKSLDYLDLSDNLVQHLPVNMFYEQKDSMQILNLNRNKLDEIPIESFKFLGHLKYLYLGRNQIKVLRNYSFGFMFNLIELYLSENRIESIELNAFSIDERSYYGPGQIEKLDLSFNKLVYLNQSIFTYLTNLRYLIVNNNRLKYIDPVLFQGVNYLISLDLRLNQIDNLTFLIGKNFSDLRYLHLANNHIEYLRPGQFMHLKSLNFLDLSANRIKYINTCAFYGLQDTIRRLFLNWNRISRLNTCAFTLSFKYLRFVQIMHNPLNCTDNCEFFFTIYNPPYSINYQGLECLNNTLSFTRVCSQNHYDYIYKRCQLESQSMDCPVLLHDENFNFQKDVYFDYDYSIERMMLQDTNYIYTNSYKISFLLFNVYFCILYYFLHF